MTFTYSTIGPAKNEPVIATARVHGRAQVIARGRIRHHRLTLTFRHLRPGRYLVTLLALQRDRAPVLIGRTMILVR
jgi:hypothetical protein